MTTTWEILKHLMKHEMDAKILENLVPKAKTFSKLKQDIGAKYNSTFSRALARLSKYGLIFHKYIERHNPYPHTNSYSFYAATPLGKKLISLYQEIEPIAYDEIAAQTELSKSEFIETYLLKNPKVKEKLSRYKTQELVHCDSCGKEIGSEDIKIVTPKYGTLCLDCWSEKAGEIIEKHPVTDSKSNSPE